MGRHAALVRKLGRRSSSASPLSFALALDSRWRLGSAGAIDALAIAVVGPVLVIETMSTLVGIPTRPSIFVAVAMLEIGAQGFALAVVGEPAICHIVHGLLGLLPVRLIGRRRWRSASRLFPEWLWCVGCSSRIRRLMAAAAAASDWSIALDESRLGADTGDH